MVFLKGLIEKKNNFNKDSIDDKKECKITQHAELKGLYTLGRFSDIFTRKTISVTSGLLSCIPFPYEKASKLKGNNLLPKGAHSSILVYGTHSRPCFRRQVKQYDRVANP